MGIPCQPSAQCEPFLLVFRSLPIELSVIYQSVLLSSMWLVSGTRPADAVVQVSTPCSGRLVLGCMVPVPLHRVELGRQLLRLPGNSESAPLDCRYCCYYDKCCVGATCDRKPIVFCSPNPKSVSQVSLENPLYQ